MQKRVSDLHDPLFSQEYVWHILKTDSHFPARSVAHCAPQATPGPWYNTMIKLYLEIWLNSTCIAVSVDEISLNTKAVLLLPAWASAARQTTVACRSGRRAQ